MSTQSKFKIVQGHDWYNDKPIYQVLGVNNDYCGEWHTEESDAMRELSDLDKPETNDQRVERELNYILDNDPLNLLS